MELLDIDVFTDSGEDFFKEYSIATDRGMDK